jgi:hypothetical protein
MYEREINKKQIGLNERKAKIIRLQKVSFHNFVIPFPVPSEGEYLPKIKEE